MVDDGLDRADGSPPRALAGAPGPSGRRAPRTRRSRRTCCAGPERSRWPCAERSRGRPAPGGASRAGAARMAPGSGPKPPEGGRLPCGGRETRRSQPGDETAEPAATVVHRSRMRRTSPSSGPDPGSSGGPQVAVPPVAGDPAEPFGPPSIQTEAVIPPVVLVVVAHDPGEWFDEDAGQHRRPDLLEHVDAGHRRGQRRRRSPSASPRSAPDAHVRRLDDNVGFGPAANEVLTAVEGAAFYLFCHDDVRLEPDVVQVMVEEAFRSNAGIVGAKVVEWNDPARILQVGMGGRQDRRAGALGRTGRARPGAARRGARRVLRPRRGDAGAGRPVRARWVASTPRSSCSARTSTCRGAPTWPAPGCWWRPARASPTSRP